jgi:anti-sigma B factor antagonist
MHPPLFRVTTRRDADRATVAVSGELDLASVTTFDEALRKAREAGGPLTIDLSDLEFIDSSGLGVLVRFNNLAATDGFEYDLIPGPAAVHRAFVLSGLDQMLPFAPAPTGS